MQQHTSPGRIKATPHIEKAHQGQISESNRINKSSRADLPKIEEPNIRQNLITQGDAFISEIASIINESMAKQFKQFKEVQSIQNSNILDQIKSLRSILMGKYQLYRQSRNTQPEEVPATPQKSEKNSASAKGEHKSIQQTRGQNQSQPFQTNQVTAKTEERPINNKQAAIIEAELERFKGEIIQNKEKELIALQQKIDVFIKQKEQTDHQLDKLRQLASISKQSKQKVINKTKKVKDEYETKIQMIEIQHKQQLSFLKTNYSKELELLNLKLAHKDKHQVGQTRITSNSRFQDQKLYAFIEAKVQQFEGRKIIKADLLFQSDFNYQNFGYYLFDKEGQSFPLLMLFYSTKKVLFGAYINHFDKRYKKDETSKKIQTFLFNATNQRVFFSSNSSKNLNPVIFSDGYLYFGNRQIELKNNNLKSVRVYCGCMLGEQYYVVGHRESLTREEGEEILLDRVQIHRLHFENNPISEDTPIN